MEIVILLPLAAFAALLLVLLGRASTSAIQPIPWQGKYLLTVGTWGAYLVLLTESLSLFKGLSRWPVAGGWLLGFVILLVFGIQTGTLKRGYLVLRAGFRSLHRYEIILLVILGALSLLLFAVAFVTPTNNVDAMNYHMPRVLQWVQNHDLKHFPTTHEYQNIRPYWAEVVILHFRILWGGDQPAGLVQWMIMLSSLVAVSGIARLLGGDRKTQWLTALVAFSIPMGLLQSTTTQNDYVSAFWVVCLAYFVILSRQRPLTKLELLGLGLSLGLGMLTKGTFFPYAAPLMAWFFLGRLADHQWKKVFLEGIVMVLVVLATNGLFWARNIQSTGGPYGAWNPLQLIRGLLPGQSLTPDTRYTMWAIEGIAGNLPREDPSREGTYFVSSGTSFDSKSVQVQYAESNARLARIARLVAMNFVSPFSAFNQGYFKVLRSMPHLFPEQFVRKLESAAWNHEDTAGSPIHLFLILVSMIAVGFKAIRSRSWQSLIYAFVLVVSLVLVSLIGSSKDIYVIRYQLGFLVLGAPLIGLLFSGWERLGYLLAAFFILYSLPYILFSNMRPVIGHKPWPTRVDSVFTASKDDLLFAINPGDEQSLVEISEEIQASDCKSVGLSYARTNLEYQIWYLLQAPQSGVTIRHLVSISDFVSQIDSAFRSCAVICTKCDAVPEEFRFSDQFDFDHMRLYLEGE